jgi:D-alanyl-D-alanine carboxypeptidase
VRYSLVSFTGRARSFPALVGAFAMVTGFASAGSAVGKPFPSRTQSRLTASLRTSWAGTWAPGVIVGVSVRDRAWTSVLGTTRRALGPRPILADRSRVGSITKTFVGTLILELVDQHKLSLDEPISRWFPQVPDGQSITIRDLGDMSSGITSYTTDSAFMDRYFTHPTAPWNPDQLIADGVALPRQPWAPGHGFNYSDTNYVMLGRIIEKVTRKPLADVMRSMLFKPLGMNASSYPTSNRLPKPFLNGYTIQSSTLGNVIDSTNWTPTAAAGAGQAVSTVPDLLKWARDVGTGALLKPATQRQRLIPNPASRSGKRAYLFGLGIDNGWLSHEGEIPGYNTEIAYLPSLKATIVVIANSDISDAKLINPAPAILKALARVIAPRNVPTG